VTDEAGNNVVDGNGGGKTWEKWELGLTKVLAAHLYWLLMLTRRAWCAVWNLLVNKNGEHERLLLVTEPLNALITSLSSLSIRSRVLDNGTYG
jgi:hypothetical protein